MSKNNLLQDHDLKTAGSIGQFERGMKKVSDIS